MKIKHLAILVLVILLPQIKLLGQIKILTLKGNEILTNKYSITEENGFKELKYLTKKGKPDFIDYDNIYSVKEVTKTESILYQPKTENDLSIENMGEYLNGRLSVDKKHLTWVPFTVNFVIGFGSGFMTKERLFIAPLFSIGTTICFGVSGQYSNPKNGKSNSNYYINGFKDQTTKHRIISSLIGSISGFVAGSFVYYTRK